MMLSSIARRRILSATVVQHSRSASSSVSTSADAKESTSTNDNTVLRSNTGGLYRSEIHAAIKKAKYRPKTAAQIKAEQEALLQPDKVEPPPLPKDQRPGVLVPYFEEKHKKTDEPLTEEDLQLLLDSATTKQDAHWIIRGLICCQRSDYILTKEMAQKSVSKILKLHPDMGGILILQNFNLKTRLYFALESIPLQQALENILEVVQDESRFAFLQHRMYGGTAALWDQMEKLHQLLCYRKFRPFLELNRGKAKKYHRFAQLHHGPTPYQVDLMVRILLQVGSPQQKKMSPRKMQEKGLVAEEDNQDDGNNEEGTGSLVARIERQIMKPCIAFRVPVFKKTWDLYEQAQKAENEAAVADEVAEGDEEEEEAQDEDEIETREDAAKEDVAKEDVAKEDVSLNDGSKMEEEPSPSLKPEDGEVKVPITDAPITLSEEETKKIIDSLMYRGKRFVTAGFIRR